MGGCIELQYGVGGFNIDIQRLTPYIRSSKQKGLIIKSKRRENSGVRSQESESGRTAKSLTPHLSPLTWIDNDPGYFKPAEVETLLGIPTKARDQTKRSDNERKGAF